MNRDPILMRTIHQSWSQSTSLWSKCATLSNPGPGWIFTPNMMMNYENHVLSLSRSIFVVMRYLFAFLNHLSGSRLASLQSKTKCDAHSTNCSDENMMDPYNIAICFGPTLVPIPTDRDQVGETYFNLNSSNYLMLHSGPISEPCQRAYQELHHIPWGRLLIVIQEQIFKTHIFLQPVWSS